MKKHNRRKRRGSQLEMYSPHSLYGKLKEFGGSRLKSHPKRHRPIELNKNLHLVLKSSRATGKFSMKTMYNFSVVKGFVYSLAARFKVKIVRFENVGNHLHIVLMVSSQKAYVSFIRGVTSSIARHITGAKKQNELGIKFWDARPYSRIITWGRDLKNIFIYLNRNRIQAIGFDLFVKEQLQLSG